MSKENEVARSVQQRIEQEALALGQTAAPVVPDEDFILQCLRENVLGDARLFNLHHRGKFVFVKRWGRFISWAGHHWQEDIIETVFHGVEAVCADYLRVAACLYEKAKYLSDDDLKANEKLRESLHKRVARLRDTTGRDKLLRFSHTIQDPLAIDGEELDQQPYLLAFQNGVVDLRTGDFSPGKPTDYILNACPVEWQGIDAESGEWEVFFNSCHEGKGEVVAFLQRLFGYGILGVRKDHVWAVHFGTRGRNGKDVLQNILTATLGRALCGMVPTEMLLDTKMPRNPSGPSPDIMALRGKRLAFCSEAEDKQRFAISKIKALTGGGPIQGRALQDKLLTEWLQSHILHLFTNEIPRAKADDDAFWTRLLVIPWNIRFVDNPTTPDERKRDPDMEEKLRQHLPGVAAWLVRGALEYQRLGLNPPEAIMDCTRERRESNDEVGEFLADCCDIEKVTEGREPKTRIGASDLLDAFNFWFHKAKDQSYSYSARRFGDVMSKKRFEKKKSGGMVYLGVSLAREFREELDKAKDSDGDRPRRRLVE